MSREFIPRPYQAEIIRHILSHERVAVWAGMGMGKTSSTLYALDYLKRCGELDGPALVLAPLRVAASTWPDEVTKWEGFDLTVAAAVGTPKQREKALKSGADVITCNYEGIPWLVKYYGDKWPFSVIVADESTRLKGFRTRSGGMRARALANVAHSKTRRFIELTGTPSPNGLLDLWGQAWFLDCGKRLGRTFSAYQRTYFNPVRVGSDAFAVKWEPAPWAQEAIQAKLKDLCISLDARDHFDIKEPILNTIKVSLPAEARRVYEDLQKVMFAELTTGEDIDAVNAAARTMKCLQVASGAIYTDDRGAWAPLHDEKIEALRSIIEEAAGAPVLVAYQWKSDAERLLKAIPGARLLDKDPATIRAWNQGKIPVLLAHPASAGHGLNLQDGGNILVFFSQWWDLEQYQQIVERIGPTRQAQAGHPRPVFIYHIVAKGTVDEAVAWRRSNKRSVQDALLAYMKKE